MPIPAKQCPGSYTEEIRQDLASNKDRAQWRTHPCEICGKSMGAVLVQGKWQPEQHWPSVAYVPRKQAKVPRG